MTLALSQVTAKIWDFQALPDGWLYGRGHSPSDATCERSEHIVTRFILAGFQEGNAFCGADGEILVTAYNLDETRCSPEVVIEPNGLYQVGALLDADGVLYDINLDEVERLLAQ